MRDLMIPLLIVASFLLLAADASACPGCKEAVAAQAPGDGPGLVDGYFWSILFMMGMPFALFGTGAFFVTRAVRKGLLPEL